MIHAEFTLEGPPANPTPTARRVPATTLARRVDRALLLRMFAIDIIE